MPITAMKIGILTFHFSANYGALIQAYALRQFLRSEGHDAEFINYQPHHLESGIFRIGLSKSVLRANAKSAFLLGTQLRARTLHRVSLARLEDFKRQCLGVDSPPLRRPEDVSTTVAGCNLIVVGSDQIWRPSEQYGLDATYFADFPCGNTRRVSYAASWGAAQPPPQYHAKIASLTNNLDALSVREGSGAAFLAKLTGREVECVPDPTILLDSFAQVTESSAPPPAAGQIFSYVLRSNSGVSTICRTLAAQLGCNVFSGLNLLRRWNEPGAIVEGGPAEWLANIAASQLVLTNSFHATLLSVLFNRRFVALELPGSKAALSERLRGMLQQVGLQDRLIKPYDIDLARAFAGRPIDWQPVNARIVKWRNIGRAYLRHEIGNAVDAQRG